ncbi:MAG: signal peptidase II [Bacteroidales bacterium]|nr:signal peptidase II [Bacteroidales bacterium]
MTKTKRKGLAASLIIIAVILVLDQVLKIWVKMHMAIGEAIPLIGNWFKLLYIENPGMAFGLMSGGGAVKLILSVFRIVAVIALFILLFHLTKKGTKFGVLVGIALITAGAMGNIIDCVFYGKIFHYAGWLQGKVVDMISVSFFPPIFNLADSAITVGVFYMIIFQWKWLKSL